MYFKKKKVQGGKKQFLRVRQHITNKARRRPAVRCGKGAVCVSNPARSRERGKTRIVSTFVCSLFSSPSLYTLWKQACLSLSLLLLGKYGLIGLNSWSTSAAQVFTSTSISESLRPFIHSKYKAKQQLHIPLLLWFNRASFLFFDAHVTDPAAFTLCSSYLNNYTK